MQDIQNTRDDYKFKLDKVGVKDVIFPIKIRSKDRDVITSVAKVNMYVSLEQYLKGINMSRLTVLLSELNRDNWIINNYKDDIQYILTRMRELLDAKEPHITFEFEYFIDKKAPISEFSGIMAYTCTLDGWIDSYGIFDLTVAVKVPITSLCPCSKAISDFSAHNQRGYVNIAVRYDEDIFIEDLISVVEDSSSCEVYPILKRIDEKFVTEKAYDNPRFVEDVVRNVADILYNDNKIKWFNINSTHQESIHPHDAYAEIEIWKERGKVD